jgi:hypothetical protein
MIAAAASINLAGSWSTFWASTSKSIGTLTTLLTTVGMLLVIGAILKYVWERRRGGGSSPTTLLWTLLVGGVLAGPDVFIPTILTLADDVINAISSVI